MADLQWQSVSWPCGSTYEGLVSKSLCQVRGVFKYPRGDRYEGEYEANQMTGYGVYVWSDGTVYRGQWKDSTMHGCGVKINRQPNGTFLAEEGQFLNDEWVGVMACSVDRARAAAAEADKAAMLARAFELEPERAAAQQQAKKKGGQQRAGSQNKQGQQQRQQAPIPPAGAPAAPENGRDWAPLGFLRSLLPK